MKNHNLINKSTAKKIEEMTDEEKIKNALNFLEQIEKNGQASFLSKRTLEKNETIKKPIPARKDTYREQIE